MLFTLEKQQLTKFAELTVKTEARRKFTLVDNVVNGFWTSSISRTIDLSEQMPHQSSKSEQTIRFQCSLFVLA